MSHDSAFAVTFRFHGDLAFFLKDTSARGQVVRVLREKTSIKDAIESCGVPHVEVDVILCDEMPTDFAFQLTQDTAVEVYPASTPWHFYPAHRLQRRHLRRFVLDGHLGKLARDLRLLGIDTTYANDADDLSLVRLACEEERVLLTRDRRLLMRAVVRDGYCPRSVAAEEQTVEVIRRFDLASAIQPYTRCLCCNGLLERVEKDAVSAGLEPLTKIYYAEFRRCAGCARVYWPGSHFARLEERIVRICAALTIGRLAGG